VLSLLEAVEWCLRLKPQKGLAVSAGFWKAVLNLVWYLRLAMIVGCLWQVNHLSLGLVEMLEVVQAQQELLEELCWLE